MDPDTFNYTGAPESYYKAKVAAARAAVAACGGIVSAAQLAERWGLSKQRIWQLTRLDGFPEPLGGGWLASEVDAWNAARLDHDSPQARRARGQEKVRVARRNAGVT